MPISEIVIAIAYIITFTKQCNVNENIQLHNRYLCHIIFQISAVQPQNKNMKFKICVCCFFFLLNFSKKL